MSDRSTVHTAAAKPPGPSGTAAAPPVKAGGVAVRAEKRARGQAPSLRYRIGVGVRAIAAIGGGYGCAALVALDLAYWPGLAPVEAVTAGMLASFAVMAGVVLWVFVARSAVRASSGVALLLVVLYGLLRVIR